MNLMRITQMHGRGSCLRKILTNELWEHIKSIFSTLFVECLEYGLFPKSNIEE